MKVSLVVVLAAAASVANGFVYRSDGCPEPYERLDATRCVLADPFKLRKFKEALEFCSGHDGNLVTYDNCPDQLLIWDYIHSEETLASKSYWMGATDEEEEGTWFFTHEQRVVPMGNPFWKHGEPSMSTNNNCAILQAAANHRWVDISCTSSANVICLRNG
ncbi:hypothetical protein O3P69_018571 [Scylla paramamosain]|uniref:C-type lectin domain-containing protein n=1 Tax=Scylla paramamosain TaxID=85552 RepID=A0AAW0T2U0_SCYPA